MVTKKLGFLSFYRLGPDATTDTSGVMEARLQPWLGESLQGLNGGVRRMENECIVGFCNLTTQGVLAVDKLHFALQQITTLAHAHPKTFIALVILPNRAGDLRSSPCKSGTYLSNHFIPERSFYNCFILSNHSFKTYRSPQNFHRPRSEVKTEGSDDEAAGGMVELLDSKAQSCSGIKGANDSKAH